MSNDFYNLTTPIPAREIARAERVNSEFSAVEAGFDMLLPGAAILARTGMWATASGGPNNYVLTLPKPPTAYVAGMQIAFRATGANTTGVSVNVNGLGAKAVVNNASGAALAAGELAGAAGTIIVIVYDGLAAFRLISAGAPIDSTPGETTTLYDLVDDGTTDQADELEALIEEFVAAGRPLDLVGNADGSSEILIDRRIVLDAMPPSMSVSRITLKFNAANGAGIYIRGQEVELPVSGKAKLQVDVDVSEGAVTAFDIDVSANTDIVDLLVADAAVIIRGENDADGEALDEHRHEDIVVSCVQVAGTRYTLTLTNGLPQIDGDTWYREWEDSEHAVDPDYTLISVLAMAYATADMTDSRTMTIAAGKAAALGLEAGSWVEVIDDATGSDTHGTSTELLNRQTVRIAAVEAGTPDEITFDEPVRGTFTTANRARLVLLTTCPEFKLQGPGPAFPIRVVGTPPASPASRRHLIEAKYCISPEITGWRYEYVAADGSTRGAPFRTSSCYKPWVHHNVSIGPWPNFADAFNGGDYYQAWSKGDTEPLYEHNTFVGGRHSLVIANAKGAVVRFNRLGYSGFQCLDFHGENEIDVEAYGNEIVAGPDWTGRSRKVAIQVGNQTHTYGAHGALIRDNSIVGFDAAEDVGVLIVSGCSDIIVDQHFIHPVGEAVRVDADNRAPDVMIERITIAGSTPEASIGVVIDGRMQVWESEGEVSATASRPVYIDDSTGARRYVTEDEGTLGTENPTHETGTETSGDIDLEYVGPVSEETIPIDGVRVLADLSRAGVEIQQSRAQNVTVGTSTTPSIEPLSFVGSVIDLSFLDVDGDQVAELDASAFVLVPGEVENSADVQLLRVAAPTDDAPAYIRLPEVSRLGRPIRFFSVSPAVSTLDPIFIQGPPSTITVADVATTSASADVTVGEYVRDFRPGDPIEHDNFPADTTILSRDVDAGTLTMSANATATGTADLEVTITNAVWGDRTTGARQYQIPRPIAGNTNGVQFEIVCVSTEPGRPPVYVTDQGKDVVEGWYEKPGPSAGGDVTGSQEISVATVSTYRKVLTGNLTIGLTDRVSGLVNGVFFDLTQDDSGGHSITITDLDAWIGGTPTMPTDAGDRVFFTLYCTDDDEIFGIYAGAVEA